MRANLLTIGAWMFACCLGAVAQDSKVEKAQDDKFDGKKLIGTWVYVSGARAGVAASDDNLASNVVINDKEFQLGGLPDGSEFVMAYKLKTDTSPVRIDIEITEGPVPEGKASGILRFDGEQLELCYDPSGNQYPGSFESTADNGYHIFRLKRKGAAGDAEKLVGSWKYTSGTRAGEKIDPVRLEGEFTATLDKFEIPAGPDDKFVMRYKIDSAKKPAAIDIEIESGPAPEGKALGIVKFDGDTWTLCYDPTGAKRPEKFESTAENGYFLFEMKRATTKGEDTPEK